MRSEETYYFLSEKDVYFDQLIFLFKSLVKQVGRYIKFAGSSREDKKWILYHHNVFALIKLFANEIMV